MTIALDAVWAAFDELRAPLIGSQPAARPDWECGCGGLKIFNSDGLPTCSDCGRADYSYVSDEPEWRGGMDDDGAVSDPSRVGAPTNLDHFSAAWNTGTIMTVKSSAAGSMKRLARINFHTSMNHKDRSLFHSYADMDRVGKQILSLPDNVMYAAKIKYRHFSESTLTRGAIRVGVKANCIFQACKEFGVARTTQEIAAAFEIPVRDMARTTEIFLDQVPEAKVTVTTPSDLIARFWNSVTNVNESDRGRLKMRIISTCKKLEDSSGLQGRTPKAVACAVMWTFLKEKGVTKAELCKICDVSVPTLTKLEAIVMKDLKALS
jgi:transcription initiation factor TFIIIB Brf1 subunit/transcription initiation factor TFIIB